MLYLNLPPPTKTKRIVKTRMMASSPQKRFFCHENFSCISGDFEHRVEYQKALLVSPLVHHCLKKSFIMTISSLQIAAASKQQTEGFESTFQAGLDLSEFGVSLSQQVPCASAQRLQDKQAKSHEAIRNERADSIMENVVRGRVLQLKDALSVISSTASDEPARAAHPNDDPYNSTVLTTDLAATLCSMHGGDDHGGGKHMHSLSKMKSRATTTANRKAYSANKPIVKAQQRKQMANKKAKKSKHVRTGWKGKPVGRNR